MVELILDSVAPLRAAPGGERAAPEALGSTTHSRQGHIALVRLRS